MERSDFAHPLDEATSRLIRRKATQLSRRPEFRRDGHDDIQHDIAAALLSRFQRFAGSHLDRARVLNRLFQQIIANLLRDRQAKCRKSGKVRSLDDRAPNDRGEGLRLADILTQEDASARTGRAPADAQRQVDLAITLAEVLAEVPEELRDLAELLQVHSLAETARLLGVARSTLISRLKHLGAAFERAGLRDFL